jgi:hypothetical protein
MRGDNDSTLYIIFALPPIQQNKSLNRAILRSTSRGRHSNLNLPLEPSQTSHESISYPMYLSFLTLSCSEPFFFLRGYYQKYSSLWTVYIWSLIIVTRKPNHVDVTSKYVEAYLNVKPHILETRSTKVYPKVSRLASWSENCKWYISLPLGEVISLFCESV